MSQINRYFLDPNQFLWRKDYRSRSTRWMAGRMLLYGLLAGIVEDFDFPTDICRNVH